MVPSNEFIQIEFRTNEKVDPRWSSSPTSALGYKRTWWTPILVKVGTILDELFQRQFPDEDVDNFWIKLENRIGECKPYDGPNAILEEGDRVCMYQIVSREDYYVQIK